MVGGIEASLRRIAHYDYWSNKVRRSVLIDSRADLLVYGNGERAVVEIAHRLAAGQAPESITDLRGTAFSRPAAPAAGFEGWTEVEPHNNGGAILVQAKFGLERGRDAKGC